MNTMFFAFTLICSGNSQVGKSPVDRYLFQRTPWAVTYHFSGDRVLMHDRDGQVRELKGVDSGGMAVFQSGPYLLIKGAPTTERFRIYKDGVLFREIDFAERLLTSIVDYLPNRLFLGGYTSEFTELRFLAVDDSGNVLREVNLPFVDKTLYSRDANRMSAVLSDGTWFVWVPARLEVLVFDTDLNLQDIVSIDIPEDVLKVAEIERLLFQEPLAAKRQAQCEALLGKTIAALPASFFLVPEGLAIGYLCANLTDCGDLTRVNTREPVTTEIRTELFFLDRKHLKITGRKSIKNRYIHGLFGDFNRICGKEKVKDRYPLRIWEDVSWP